MTDSKLKPYPVINKLECKGCNRCVYACPENAIEMGNELNNAGYIYAQYKGEGCIGCRDCYYTCPEPLAIEVHNYKEEGNEISKMIKKQAKAKEE